ncbi:glycolate oxidase subunit GlcE [Polymorphum gilvum]|uniref:Glycolate oxidase subunits GlcE n=1 Tax=Polymorphum gilvum (strain LMG 25793 / CGMCC 1.9160 / SL003B-26A1) TaxID=991905 RepID=F2J063_POLGS|nr:glycolate oxidase subunit GlcE [Polymorphum gilvum]ADZ71898.1 Glycolate oxidase subunits GlcE [Polymorphum gilvum SL003B-26A1]
MNSTFKPQSTDETRDVLRWAAAEETPLEILGQGSKRALGRPVQAAHVLDLSDLAGVEVYEPAELVLTARAGTPIADVEALVAAHNQELSFEPMDYGPLLGQEPGRGTIGGVLAGNLAGPRRIKAGAARDHILGMEAVSGRGEIFKAGGRVVKNVTGYDLPRVLCGSWGTLAVATTVTLKVNPRSETSATFLLPGLSDRDAVRAMCAAMGSSAEVSAAAHLPEGLFQRLGLAGQDRPGPVTLLRLEGFGPSVDYRFRALGGLLAPFGIAERVEHDASRAIWSAVRDCLPFAGARTPVWRLSVPPTRGAEVVDRLEREMPVEAFYDWSGGLVWLHNLDGELHDVPIRAAIADCGGGHATLVRASASSRVSAPPLQPQPAPLAALAARLKAQFDPHGVLNPGRMRVDL